MCNNKFKKELKEELQCLSDFAENMDNGKLCYYKYIAISLRKIFYDSNNSISLLTHLGIKDQIEILSYSSSKSSIDGEVFFMGMGILKNGKYIPNCGEGAIRKIVTLKEYFNEIVFIYNNYEYSRKDIFITAANQDGGAHYDNENNIEEKYKILKNVKIPLKIPFLGVNTKIENIIQTILRQMVCEILNSDDIKKYL